MEKKGITQKNESFDSASKLKPVLIKKSFNGAQNLRPSNSGSGSTNQQQTQSNNSGKKK